MKKTLLLLFALSFACVLFAQKQNVAVYVTGDSNVDESVLQVVASELVTGFTADERYSAVERTSDFLRSITQEQVYQTSGNVDDSQICELGKQFGADLVCVVNILPFRNDYYCNARIISVQSAAILESVRETSSLNTLDDIILLSDKLVYTLTGKKTKELQEQERQQRLAQQQAAQQKKLEQQQELLDMTERMGERLGESIVNMADAIQAAKHPYYFLKVCNLRAHTRKVYVDGTYMGEVPSGKTVQFQVPLSLWGNCVLVQKNGYLLQASKESYTMRSQPNSRQVVTITDK